MDLVSGKVALVTGSGAGIGRAVALKFAEEGANVIVSDVDVDGGNETVAIAKHNGGKVSEIAAPTLPQPLMLLGDLSRLRVRAELDEHDVGKIALGDKVVVHANAFRGREFTGKVAAIAPIVQLGRISSPDSRY